MEQFVFVPAFLYKNKKNFNTRAVTKPELVKYQTKLTPLYQIDMLEKESNKTLFAYADSLVDKIL